MLYQNLKLAFRNILTHKSFSLINTLGLTLGFSCCIIIGLYALQESSFDRFNTHHDRIFRVNKITDEKNRAQSDALTPGLLSAALKNNIPEVIQSARFRPWFSEILVSYDSVHLKLNDVAFSDPAFLTMFDFPLKDGNKSNALNEPFTAVITESTAKKYFGRSSPIGKTLITLNNIPVRITGVLKDIPSNSSLRFSLLISFATLLSPTQINNFSWMNNWSAQVHYTFVELSKKANATDIGGKISMLMHKNFAETEFQYRTYLQPLDDIHLHSAGVMYADSFISTDGKIVYTLLIIAVFVLIIACFNFINLTTAGSMARTKEIGVQKVLGATRHQLIIKLFLESFVICSIALLVAICISGQLLNLFNQMANIHLTMNMFLDWKMIGLMIALLSGVSLLAGLYPAIYMAGFKSADIFRNTVQVGRSPWLRKSLVTAQFVMSIILIICTIIVNRQTRFVSEKDLGFDKDQVLVLSLSNTAMENKSREFVDAIKKNSSVEAVSASIAVPGQGFNGFGIIPEGHSAGEHLLANVLETDADFASAYKIKMVQGRFFTSEMTTDTANSIVINEAMARYINEKNPVGKKMEIYELKKGNIIGVMKDFNFASLHEKVQPLAVVLGVDARCISIRVKSGTVQTTLDGLEKTWRSFDKEYPFDYYFLDDKLNQYYQSDTRLLHALNIFAGLAILIACFGLFGLSLYTGMLRTKEIGIRKLLGSSVTQIVILLSRDLVKLVVIATLIAFPLAWWAESNWLNGFAYRVSVSGWIFITAALFTLFISLAAISFQAIRSALAHPVKSLRRE